MPPPLLIACLAALVSVAVWVGAAPAARLRRRLAGGGMPLTELWRVASRSRMALAAAALRRGDPRTVASAAAVAGLLASAKLRSPAPLVALPLAAWAASRWRRRRWREAAVAARRQAVSELCATLAGELHAGRTPAQALRWAATECGDPVLAARLPGVADRPEGAPAALAGLAALPGGEDLRQLAACWQVAEGVGAGLAAALDRLAAALRANEALRAEVAVELAGARATARLLAALPVVGLLLGTAIGADPTRVLLRTWPGLACLGLGLTLAVAGLRWTDRIAHAAEAAP